MEINKQTNCNYERIANLNTKKQTEQTAEILKTLITCMSQLTTDSNLKKQIEDCKTTIEDQESFKADSLKREDLATKREKLGTYYHYGKLTYAKIQSIVAHKGIPIHYIYCPEVGRLGQNGTYLKDFFLLSAEDVKKLYREKTDAITNDRNSHWLHHEKQAPLNTETYIGGQPKQTNEADWNSMKANQNLVPKSNFSVETLLTCSQDRALPKEELSTIHFDESKKIDIFQTLQSFIEFTDARRYSLALRAQSLREIIASHAPHLSLAIKEKPFEEILQYLLLQESKHSKKERYAEKLNSYKRPINTSFRSAIATVETLYREYRDIPKDRHYGPVNTKNKDDFDLSLYQFIKFAMTALLSPALQTTLETYKQAASLDNDYMDITKVIEALERDEERLQCIPSHEIPLKINNSILINNLNVDKQFDEDDMDVINKRQQTHLQEQMESTFDQQSKNWVMTTPPPPIPPRHQDTLHTQQEIKKHAEHIEKLHDTNASTQQSKPPPQNKITDATQKTNSQLEELKSTLPYTTELPTYNTYGEIILDFIDIGQNKAPPSTNKYIVKKDSFQVPEAVELMKNLTSDDINSWLSIMSEEYSNEKKNLNMNSPSQSQETIQSFCNKLNNKLPPVLNAACLLHPQNKALSFYFPHYVKHIQAQNNNSEEFQQFSFKDYKSNTIQINSMSANKNRLSFVNQQHDYYPRTNNRDKSINNLRHRYDSTDRQKRNQTYQSRYDSRDRGRNRQARYENHRNDYRRRSFDSNRSLSRDRYNNEHSNQSRYGNRSYSRGPDRSYSRQRDRSSSYSDSRYRNQPYSEHHTHYKSKQNYPNKSDSSRHQNHYNKENQKDRNFSHERHTYTDRSRNRYRNNNNERARYGKANYSRSRSSSSQNERNKDNFNRKHGPSYKQEQSRSRSHSYEKGSLGHSKSRSNSRDNSENSLKFMHDKTDCKPSVNCTNSCGGFNMCLKCGFKNHKTHACRYYFYLAKTECPKCPPLRHTISECQNKGKQPFPRSEKSYEKYQKN